MESLAVRYRPKDWEEVCSQNSIIKILSRQVELREFSNCFLFCGPSGCGKTTVARIFANKINNNVGNAIEIDAASNNGVDKIRDIVSTANQRSVDSEYKVLILDEAHTLTNQSWQALLKVIEETPKYTIFIFCTTDPQKIPATIVNRCQRFNFNRIPTEIITNRLRYICEQEGFKNYSETISYIAKTSNGQMRDSIASLEKVASYNPNDLSIETAISVLGNYSYDTYFSIFNAVIDLKYDEIFRIIDDMYNSGGDVKIFVDQYLVFCLDIMKYIIFKNCDILQIPQSMEDKIKMSINFDNADKYLSYIIDKVLSLKNMLKTDTNPKDTVEAVFLQMSRAE